METWVERIARVRGSGDEPRNVWQAVVRRDFLLSRWPWRSVGYLAAGVLVGTGTFVLLFSLIAVGAVLSMAVVGVPLLAAVCLAGVPVGALERRRAGWVDREPVPDPHPAVERPGFGTWLRARLREQATWRELAYTFVLSLLLWPVDLAVLMLGVVFPFGTLYGAVTTLAGLNHDFRPLPGWTLDSTGAALAAAPAALLGLLLGCYLVAAAAGARAALTRLVLGRRESENTDRLVELTRSRARLVDAFEAERRRIERDLHDGAQQRLVALTMTLGLARMSEGAEAGALIAQAQQQAKLALGDLRELIQGIHPQVLTDRGLPSAVADVADRSAVPVSTDFDLPRRLPESVESTAYFVVCEALANVAKHSGAEHAEVSGRLDGGRLLVEVRDDGRGGADAGRGSGLAGLADRLAVVDGRLLVSSPPGGPTVLKVEIPVAAGAGR
ncbi:sensor histidine kinase [Kitasatospora sp. NPDC018619]|uniref:sensor histidine kinase n=1 Tax=unclassified Kitasatospora TaxID=2633591 RepID=UPI00378839D9